MASNNLGFYTCLIKLLKRENPKGKERNIEILQLDVFNIITVDTFESKGKAP